MDPPKPPRESFSDRDLADMRQEVLRWIDRSQTSRGNQASSKKKGKQKLGGLSNDDAGETSQSRNRMNTDVADWSGKGQDTSLTPTPRSNQSNAKPAAVRLKRPPKAPAQSLTKAPRAQPTAPARSQPLQPKAMSVRRPTVQRAKRPPVWLAVVLVFTAALGIAGTYAFGWGRYLPAGLLRFVPLPAVYAGNEVLWLGEYYRDLNAFEGWRRANGKQVTSDDARQDVLARFVERVALKSLSNRYGFSLPMTEVERQLKGLFVQAGSEAQFRARVVAQFPGWGIEDFSGKILQPFLTSQSLRQRLADQPGQWPAAARQAEDVARQIRTGELTFTQAAQKYSRGDYASVGGDYGYRRLNELPSELQTIIPQLPVNELSDPLRASDGLYLVQVNEQVRGAQSADDRYRIQAVFIPLVDVEKILNLEMARIRVLRLLP